MTIYIYIYIYILQILCDRPQLCSQKSSSDLVRFETSQCSGSVCFVCRLVILDVDSPQFQFMLWKIARLLMDRSQKYGWGFHHFHWPCETGNGRLPEVLVAWALPFVFLFPGSGSIDYSLWWLWTSDWSWEGSLGPQSRIFQLIVKGLVFASFQLIRSFFVCCFRVEGEPTLFTT